jgi:prepilin-type N-terminal cleavage/methylation domain-containing protein
MKGGKKQTLTPFGYTIVEVMIVLAVSGTMFLIASSFISGKQQRTAFSQGVNELASSLQKVIEQVNGGQYSDVPISCTITSHGVTPVSGGSSQGTNAPCVFLGKLIHFNEGGTGGVDSEQYEIFSLAGLRADGLNQPTSQLNEIDPTPIADLTTQETVPQHLDIQKITVTPNCGPVSESYGLAILQGLGSSSNPNGAQDSALYCVIGLGQGLDTNHAGQKLNPKVSPYVANGLSKIQKVDICVSDGQRYADVFLGLNGDSLNATVDLSRTTQCLP